MCVFVGQSFCKKIVKWVNELWYKYIMKYYIVVKVNKLVFNINVSEFY